MEPRLAKFAPNRRFALALCAVSGATSAFTACSGATGSTERAGTTTRSTGELVTAPVVSDAFYLAAPILSPTATKAATAGASVRSRSRTAGVTPERSPSSRCFGRGQNGGLRCALTRTKEP